MRGHTATKEMKLNQVRDAQKEEALEKLKPGEKVLCLNELTEYFDEHGRSIRGAYIVRWYSADGKTPESITRLEGADPHGIIYIGGSEKGLANRLKVRTEDFDTPSKYSGWFQALHAPAGLRGCRASSISKGAIRVEIRQGKDGMQLEADLLAEYLKIYGELPPLNRSWPEKLTKKVREKLKKVTPGNA